jgi:hypothetical protein
MDETELTSLSSAFVVEILAPDPKLRELMQCPSAIATGALP